MREHAAIMEQRRHMRYQSGQTEVVQLFYFDGDGMKVDVPALVTDESRKGMAVIVVGSHRFLEKSTIYWQETVTICTHCTIIYCKKLDEGVCRLAIKLKDIPSQPPK